MNKVKVYALAILLYLVLNGLVFELGITLPESAIESDLFPIFPFTRIAFLIMAILLARQYISKRTGEHKQASRAVRYIKIATLSVVFGILAVGALASVTFYDNTEYEPTSIEIPDLRQIQQSEFQQPDFSSE